MNFIRIFEASSLAEKNVDLDQSRVLYNGGEENMCVCFRGKGRLGAGRGSYTHKSSSSAYPRNQRGVVAEFEPLFGENHCLMIGQEFDLLEIPVHRSTRMSCKVQQQLTGGSNAQTLPSMRPMDQIVEGGCGFWTFFFWLAEIDLIWKTNQHNNSQ